MAEAYGLQNSIGGGAGYCSAAVSTIAAVDGTAGTQVPVVHIGTSSTAGRIVYTAAAIFGDLVITEFWAVLGVIPTTVAPVFKFWRRPNATVGNVAAGGTGDVAINCGTASGTTMTIPLTNPTPVTGAVYCVRFTGGNVLNPGEAFIVEIDAVDSGAAATALLGHTGYYSRFNADSVQASAGAAKPNTGSVGRVYVVAS